MKVTLRGRFWVTADSENISISFYSARPGISYTAQSSADLTTWTSDGVTLSDLGEDNRRTASVEGAG
ncbi:hypothetical protein N8652_03400, partial [bacterium]|nr:hypothetical protein [bacterium]